MYAVNPLLAVGTPCRLFLEVVFNADNGESGRCWLEKLVTWPGVPTLEQKYIETNVAALRPDAYKLEEISFDGAPVVNERPQLEVRLQSIDVTKWLRERREAGDHGSMTAEAYDGPLDRGAFLETIGDFYDDDWSLFCNQAHWWEADDVLLDTAEKPKRIGETLLFDGDGNLLSDEDEDEDDDDDDDDDE